MGYKLKPIKQNTQRPQSKLSDQLAKNYAKREGLEKKPINEPALDAVYAKILKDLDK